MGQLLQFFSDEYMPHGHCYLWLPSILWTNVVSDLAIALAYFSIPIILLMLIRLRQDIKFKGIFVLFAAFILMCGITHLFGIYTIWHGSYGWHGVAKAITGIVSLATVVALVASRHALLSIPTTEKLERALCQAEAANIAKRDFLASMSHEIRTPMNGVLGMLHIALKQEQDPLQKKRLESAQKSACTLLALINDIIDFSKVEAGKLDIERIEFNIQHLLKEVMHSFVIQRKNPGVEFILDVTDLEADTLIGDPARIRQILINLLSNAMKFTPQGEVSLTVALSNLSSQQAELVCVVRDTGIGIDPEKINELFEPFSQADTSTTRNYGGAGLGLAICKQLAGLMEGDIQASSILGKGSEFIFRIPVGISESSNHAERSDELLLKDIYAADHSGETVIVIEPHVSTSQSLLCYLKKARYQTLSSKGCEQVMEILNTMPGPIRLIIDRDALNTVDLTELQAAIDDFQGSAKLFLMDYAGSQPPNFSGLFSGYLDKPISPVDLFKLLQATPHEADVKTALADKTPPSDDISPAPTKGSQPPYAISVLAAEDNEINQLVINGMLEDLVTHQTFARNGKETLELLQAHPHGYDVILMDCQMPVLDGYEATRRIRKGEAGEENSNIYIIAVTANAMTGDRDRAIECGMDDYIAKPIDENQLKKAIEKVNILGRTGKRREMTPTPEVDNAKFNLPDNLCVIKFGQITHALISRPERLLLALGHFIHDYQTVEAQVKRLIQNQENGSLRTMIHNLKGISGNFGMDNLCQLATEADKELSNSRSLSGERLEKLIKSCQLAVRDAQAIIAANGDQ